MNTIFLALGSNIGNKNKNIQKAINLLQKNIYNIKQAPFYETRPIGYKKQDNFINTVLIGKTNLTPKQLLVFIKVIEKEVGRIARFRWGPREIDIDILLYDDLIYKDSILEIPHPRLQDRDFVLKPFLDIAPDIVHPVLKKTIKQLFENLPKNNKSII